MSIFVETVRNEYRNAREVSNYCIFDIENHMKALATSGQIWCIQGMNDLTEAEEILVVCYLNMFREKQDFDFTVR